MPYSEQTTVNDHKHLVSLLSTFLAAQGWTIDADTTAAERELHVHKAHGGEDFFFSIISSGTAVLNIQGHTAYPAANSSTAVYANLRNAAMVKAWFYAGDLWCYVVVEVAGGYYQIFGFGRLVPFFTLGTSDHEGAFVFGANAITSYLTCVSGDPTAFSLTGSSTGTFRHKPVAGAEWINHSGELARDNPYRGPGFISSFYGSNGSRPLMPYLVRVPNNPAVSASHQNFYPLGHLPGLRAVNLYQVVIGSEQTLGSDVWKRHRLPYVNPADIALSSTSTELGLALLK